MKPFYVAHVTSQSSDKDTGDSVPKVHHGRALCVYAPLLTILSLCGKKWPFNDISITLRFVNLYNSQSINRSVRLPFIRLVCQSVSLSVSRSVIRPVGQLVCPARQSVSKSVSRSISQTTDHSVSYVPVKSKLQHPPGQPLGHLNFWKIFVQMPHHRSIPGDQMPPTHGKLFGRFLLCSGSCECKHG